MSLTFHCLNVGHGSSVIVEYEAAGARSFGVIDSQCSASETPKALAKLQQLGAQEISFICLTHPHLDHYSGLYKVIAAFQGRIGNFFSFSIGEVLKHSKALKSLAITLRKVEASTDNKQIKAGMYELCKILQWADGLGDSWIPCDGEANSIAPVGFAGVEITTIQPPKLSKGSVLELIRNEDPQFLGSFMPNEISLAIEFCFSGRKVILGGDATERNWSRRAVRYEARKGVSIDADAVNLPHHGSIHDCSGDVLVQLFDSSAPKRKQFAITSGDGQHHPHVETIRWLENHGIEPYCTGLLPICGAKTLNLLPLPGLDPVIARWAREVSDDVSRSQPCQGDVTLVIADDGSISISSETNAPCAFRGDYDRLFAA